MTQKDLVVEVEKIAEEMVEKKYQKEYKSVIIENYIKFLDNEKRPEDKERLLRVLKNVKWYSNDNTDVFFSNIITEMIDKTVGDLFFVCKNKKTSSCYSIITNLLTKGKLEEKNVINYDKNTKRISHIELEEGAMILIMDDYSGSGNTIIEMIEAVENEYSAKNVSILIYVWQEKAIERINKYLTKDLNNHYEIIKKGIVLENSYKEKFGKDTDSIIYIESICDKCQQENVKYGYMETGAMLTFNGISPNNNISMLWNNHINHNNCRWFPAFNREYAIEYLRKKKNEYLRKNKKEVLELYNNSSLEGKITYKEFQILIVLFNTYSVRLEYIKQAFGFDTIEEITEIIEKFINYGIITYSTENILQFVDRKIIDEMKRIEEKISESVGIIKGTRKQISKNTPLE